MDKDSKTLQIIKPSPSEWLCLITGLILTFRYLWILDDATIYFRYIDNLLFLKIGLVYNFGEYVEGFTSPLWLMIMALFRLVGLSYWNIVMVAALFSFTLFWALALKLNRQLSPRGALILNFPLIYLCANYAVTSYFSSGLEWPLIQLLAVVYGLFILNPADRKYQLFLSLSPLARPELVFPFLLCILWSWRRLRKFPWEMTILGGVFLGAWTLFRIYYYADLFPNTFYAKNLIDITQGLLFIHDTFWPYKLYFIIPYFLLLFFDRRSKISHKIERAMMILIAFPILAYVIKVGGAHIHFRYLSFPFILLVLSMSGIAEHYLTENPLLSKYRRIASASLGLLFILVFASFYPMTVEGHPFIDTTHKSREVNKINGMQYSRTHRHLSFRERRAEIDIGRMLSYRRNNKEFKYKDIYVTHWCAEAYRRFNSRIIQRHGLTDSILARVDQKPYRPAHRLLQRHAEDIKSVQKNADYIGRGMFMKAVNDRTATQWIGDNIETIKIIEKKMYNNHDIVDNIKLAFNFPGKIKLRKTN